MMAIRKGRLAMALAAVAALAASAQAHLGERVFAVQELSSSELPDLHDGTLEDWDEVILLPALTQSDFGPPPGASNPPPSTDDFALRVLLAWHHGSQRLLVGIEVLDDVQLPPGDGLRWTERIDFAVDGDHSGGPYHWVPIDGTAAPEATQAQNYEIGLSWVPEVDPLVNRWIPVDLVNGWALQEPWLDLGVSSFSELPTQSVVELAVTPWDAQSSQGPEASRRSRLEGDRYIGLQMRILDEDPEGSGTSVDAFVLGGARTEGPGTTVWESSSLFVDAVLIPCDYEDCSRASTAVAPSSWGRVKAAASRP